MRALLIVNEFSGDKVPNAEKIALVQQRLLPAGFDLETILVSPENPLGDKLRSALAAGVRTVLVGGGDGTIGPIAQELVNSEAALGVIPMGTYNNIARSIGVPTDIDQACEIITQGHVKPMDAGQKPDGTYFFEAAGGGLDAALFPLGEEIKGGNWARLAQFASMTVRYAPQRITLSFDCQVRDAVAPERKHSYSQRTLDGHHVRLRALIVGIANGPYYGGRFTIAPSARLDDGRFTVVVFRRFSKLELIRHFLSISQGKRQYSPKVETFRAASVTISARQPLKLHADGIPCGEAPATFRCVPKALRVFSPE